MHVLRIGRVLLPVLIVAAVVAAGSSVLSARPDLDKAKHNVDTSWSSLAGQLNHRYVLLAAVDDTLRPVVGPIRTLVGDVDTALARWHDARQHTDVAAQVAAANDVEAFARRLLATEATSPRVRGNAAALAALGQFLSDPARRAAAGFNQNVTSYERERRGPVRAVVASVLGDGAIPVLDTTEPTVAATTSS
jgi:hypothetical protein